MLSLEHNVMDMPIAYFFKMMINCETRYFPKEKERLVVLYLVTNCRLYFYGHEFILACDNEQVHWMNFIENPGSRLIRGQ